MNERYIILYILNLGGFIWFGIDLVNNIVCKGFVVNDVISELVLFFSVF